MTATGRAVGQPALPPGPADLTILTANVLHGRADTGELATVIERETPDVVVLPEAGADFRDKLTSLVEVLGYRSWVASGARVPNGRDVTLLVAEKAGDVQVRSGFGMRIPHLEATGGVLGPRTLFAVHATAPVGRKRTARWLAELELIGLWCRAPLAPIVVGDLNATLDHAPLRAALGGCRSAAIGTGRGLTGTFPSQLPRWLGIQIDHVLVPVESVITRYEVLDLAGTDHRGVLTRIRVP